MAREVEGQKSTRVLRARTSLYSSTGRTMDLLSRMSKVKIFDCESGGEFKDQLELLVRKEWERKSNERLRIDSRMFINATRPKP